MSNWQKRAFCECGESFDAWRGKLFFVHEECCPSCGAGKSTFTIRIARWVAAKREGLWFRSRIVEPAHWEFQA